MIELLEHNKETYKRLCDVLEDNNKCALVQATGTGKSYIAGKYIEEHANKALILAPTNAIADAWGDLLNETKQEIDTITYQAFSKEPNNYLDYDLVIADEMHHLGSDVWGKKFVETYLQSENHKIIGLTATEIRYLDNSRDMAEEIFENIRVDGCDLPTAINTGVLPTFKYVSALYCDESDFDEWKEKAGKIKDIKTQTELKGRLDVCIKNMVSVKQAVNENLTDDYKKIIVFLNNVESKETALEMFRDVFPTANFYDVDYSKQRTVNNEQISRFKEESNRAVLFAVDMLNEGIHIKGTDCVIMFRKTVSPQVYLQQLGRGLASGTDKIPVIFDFVGNIRNFELKLHNDIDSENYFVREINKKISKKRKEIVIRTYQKNIEDCLKEIDFYCKNLFSDEKIPELLETIEKIGIRKTAVKFNVEYRQLLFFLTRSGYRNKKCTRNRYDKDLAKELIKKGLSNKEILEKVGCSNGYITALRKGLGVKSPNARNKLSEKDREKIIDMYENGKSSCYISKEIGVPESTICRLLHRSGVYVLDKTNNKIPVVILKENGDFYKKFESINDGIRFIGKNPNKSSSSVSNCLAGRTKTAYGYKWLYEEDYKKMIAEQKAGEA